MDVLTSGPPDLTATAAPTVRTRYRDRRFYVAVFATAALLWAWTTWTLVRHGAVVTQDGTWYLERAGAIGRGDLRFDSVTEGTVSHYPPGYPALLSGLDAVPGLSATAGALVVNLLCWIAVAVGLTRILAAFDRTQTDLGPAQRRLLAAVAAAALFGPVLVFSSAAVLTEMVFFACWTWMIVLLLDGRVGRSRWAWSWLVALAAVALLDRYLAAPLVVGVAVVLALQGGRWWRAFARSAGFLVVSALPLVVWVWWIGGIHQETEPGVLGGRDSSWDSTMAMAAELLHVKSGREGGVTTRGVLAFGWDLGPPLGTVAVALGVLVVVVAVASFVQHGGGRGSIDATDPVVVLFVTSVLYAVPAALSRQRSGHIFLDRYWGLAGTFLLLVAVARPGSTRVERVLWWAVIAFGCWWTVHRQVWPLPA